MILTDPTDECESIGGVRRWKDGDILYAENDWLLMAYVVTDDVSKLDALKIHGPDEVFVQLISADQAEPWRDAPERRRDFGQSEP